MIGGRAMLGREWELKPHHIILKEKYKPHEPANSIILLKIVNGSAYVFKWNWHWLGVCDIFNVMSCYAISKSSPTTTTTTNDDKQSVTHLQNAFIHIIWPHDKETDGYEFFSSQYVFSVCVCMCTSVTARYRTVRKSIRKHIQNSTHDRQLAFSFAMSAQKLTV